MQSRPSRSAETRGFAMVTNAIGLVGTQVADAETAASLAASQTHMTRHASSRRVRSCPGFTRQLTDATLPEVHQQMSSYKERGRDTNTINMAIFSMANKKKCRSTSMNPPGCLSPSTKMSAFGRSNVHCQKVGCCAWLISHLQETRTHAFHTLT
jgi:hypothetical protein